MKGSNELKLNTSTIIDALQYYFDSKFRPGMSPKITAVTYKYDDFIVTFNEPDPTDINNYSTLEKLEQDLWKKERAEKDQAFIDKLRASDYRLC